MKVLFPFFILAAAMIMTGATAAENDILMEDDLMENWQDQWFLDGKLATLEHREDGLFFSAGTITKRQDRVAYNAHHAVLWTKQEFEGDIRIQFRMTRIDESDYGNLLLYIQAQGIGVGGYTEDIAEWKEKREIPTMSTYFQNMDLISLSFRGELRCKRYPYGRDPIPGRGLIAPMVDYPRISPGETYQVEVEQRSESTRTMITNVATGNVLLDHTWDTTRIPDEIEKRTVTKGRIGLRLMSTKQFIFRDFSVKRL